ncbi:hepatic leukemia factor-like [Corythoichthys intestinalis]|uniref:hepatic leukemia factor-like n=1 Tax=Corythoichthys intestinalis TaxID=161448 RepID=UPI0025A5868E|nr:hepatic leukemia factor-like [Corythoichthys intestinalis]
MMHERNVFVFSRRPPKASPTRLALATPLCAVTSPGWLSAHGRRREGLSGAGRAGASVPPSKPSCLRPPPPVRRPPASLDDSPSRLSLGDPRFQPPRVPPPGRSCGISTSLRTLFSACRRRRMEKMARPLPVNAAFLPPTHGVLKSLLENPLKLPFHHDEGFGKEKDKEKKLEDESGAANPPQSAFLGPTLWDKTLPYDGDNFQLEYMDLEEFLSENGIPANTAQSDQRQAAPPPPPPQAPQAPQAPAAPSVVDLSSRAATSVHASMQTCLRSPNATGPAVTSASSRDTPSPIDPESIQVALSYEPDPADLALSSVPGQAVFDPRKHKFSPEELKPQPMIKKARKVFIPDDLKDDKYWARRRKNNVAAKRSRDARRLKENQIAIRAGFLEKENAALRLEVADLRKELGRCKNVVAKYQARHGPL